MVKYNDLTYEDKQSGAFEIMNRTALEQLNALAGQLPAVVLQDIRIRVGDWMTSGGGVDDDYIYQQLRFAKNVIRSYRHGATANNF